MMAAKISRDPSIPLAGNSAGSSPRRPADARHHPQISPTRHFYWLDLSVHALESRMHVVAHTLHSGNVTENMVLRAHFVKERLRKQVRVAVGKGIENPPRKSCTKQYQLFWLLHRKPS